MSSVFGLDQSNRLLHVSEAVRGLACKCRCVVCDEPLIARQGAVRGHHFAHASGAEPCDASHESLLHRYAKQVIQESGGLVVPIDETMVTALGLAPSAEPVVRISLPHIEVEKAIDDVRPDLLGYTEDGVAVAIEVAYSSFCGLLKVAQFEQLGLPALEIDLRAFTPDAFDAEAVRQAVIERTTGKTWLWPKAPVSVPTTFDQQGLPSAADEVLEPAKSRLPEEIVTISGRWVSIKEFRNGDIAVKVVVYDPDVVSIVKSVARANGGRYSPNWRTWNIPRWRADAVRSELRALSGTVSIVVKNSADVSRADHRR
jgi:hypothetical protein